MLPTDTSQPTSSGTPAPASGKIVVPDNRGVKVVRACTIRWAARDLYDFWRDPERIALVVRRPLNVTAISDVESRWSVSGPPGDREIEWRAVIINDEPGSLLAWRTREGADVAHAGSIRFEPAPADEGTEVTVALEYDPPGGAIGAALAKLFPEDPGRQVADALRRFKALMEAGEIPTIDGQSHGSKSKRRTRA